MKLNSGVLSGTRSVSGLADAEIRYLFPIPFVRMRWPASDELNAELRHLILNKEANTPGMRISNVGGWHSAKDFQDWPEDCVKILVGRMHQLIRETVRRTVADPKPEHLYDWQLWSWANVNRRGHYNESHRHQPPYVWAGIYYVDPGDGEPLTGVTKIQDLSGVPKEILNNADPLEREVAIVPEAGLMALFPVSAWHYVEPYLGTRPRITIGFDMANPAFTIPTYGSARRNWWQTNFPWLMRGKQLAARRLGLRRPLR